MTGYIKHDVDDGSKFIEIMADGFRFGINLEVDPDESGWYFVFWPDGKETFLAKQNQLSQREHEMLMAWYEKGSGRPQGERYET